MSKDRLTLSADTIRTALDCVPHLIVAAKAGDKMTYGELSGKLGLHHRPARLWLSYIRDELCVANGLPLITAIVVKQGGLPGRSFLPGGTIDEEGSRQYVEAAAKAQDEVFAYSEWDRLQAMADRVRSSLK